jgi:hypothetical protein
MRVMARVRSNIDQIEKRALFEICGKLIEGKGNEQVRLHVCVGSRGTRSIVPNQVSGSIMFREDPSSWDLLPIRARQ